MTYLRYSLTILTLLLLLVSKSVAVYAMDTGFSTEPLSEEDTETFLSNVTISILTEEPQRNGIECFDVNDNGLIAIGHSSSGDKTISVYSQDGIFQYGYTFYSYGDFGVEWDNDNLNIYFVRSGVIASVTPTGEIGDILQVQNTIENNTYHNHVIHARERTYQDTTYTLKNNMGPLNLLAFSYDHLVATDSQGNERTIYSVDSSHYITVAFVCIVVLILVILVLVFVVRLFIKLLRNA